MFDYSDEQGRPSQHFDRGGGHLCAMWPANTLPPRDIGWTIDTDELPRYEYSLRFFSCSHRKSHLSSVGSSTSGSNSGGLGSRLACWGYPCRPANRQENLAIPSTISQSMVTSAARRVSDGTRFGPCPPAPMTWGVVSPTVLRVRPGSRLSLTSSSLNLASTTIVLNAPDLTDLVQEPCLLSRAQRVIRSWPVGTGHSFSPYILTATTLITVARLIITFSRISHSIILHPF